MQLSQPSPGIWAVGEQRKTGKPTVSFKKLENLSKNRNDVNKSVDLILINSQKKLLGATLDERRSQNFDIAPIKNLTQRNPLMFKSLDQPITRYQES